jgi:hypothetical protein
MKATEKTMVAATEAGVTFLQKTIENKVRGFICENPPARITVWEDNSKVVHAEATMFIPVRVSTTIELPGLKEILVARDIHKVVRILEDKLGEQANAFAIACELEYKRVTDARNDASREAGR